MSDSPDGDKGEQNPAATTRAAIVRDLHDAAYELSQAANVLQKTIDRAAGRRSNVVVLRPRKVD